MSKWQSKDSNWTIEFPNLPTFIVKLIIFYICILMVKSAIDNHNLITGILALVIVQFEFKFGRKTKKKFNKSDKNYGCGYIDNSNLENLRPKH